MKISGILKPGCWHALLLSVLLVTPALAVDLLQRYPTARTTGDTEPEHARSWDFNAEDVYHVTRFEFKVGDQFKVTTGDADLGVGHCADGVVWGVLIPRESGALTSSVTNSAEPIAHVWLRFHPAELDHLFPAETVLADGNTNLCAKMRAIARNKMTSSWQSDGKAMIPDVKYFTVYADTVDGSHRFFSVDAAAQTAEYIAAFNSHPDATSLTWATAPPVVVRTFPEAGSQDVAPGETEIKVTFSKNMTDQSWSWVNAWQDSSPEGIGKPHYDADHRTCILKVKLEPNKTYGWWINSQRFHGFQDPQGHAAIPYLLVFQTKGN